MRVRPGRLVLVGSVLVDVLISVDRLPERDGDVLAHDRIVTSGGGFNLLVGAARLGLPAIYAGRIGTGPFGNQVAGDLRRAGIPSLLPRAESDTGFDIGLVEEGGHTTYITVPGAEACLTSADLNGLELRPGDAVYVSGYDLCYDASGPALAAWLPALGPDQMLVLDPGPLAGSIPRDRLDPVLGRVDILSLNRREAAALTGQDTIETMAAHLAHRIAPGAHVVLRAGAEGCWVTGSPARVTHIPARSVRVIDATGAGDAHVAALLARLAAGRSFLTAAREANVAASLAVGRRGPASGPDLTELEEALRPPGGQG